MNTRTRLTLLASSAFLITAAAGLAALGPGSTTLDLTTSELIPLSQGSTTALAVSGGRVVAQEDEAARSGAYHAVAGTRFAFALRASSQVDLDGRSGPAPMVGHVLEGDWVTTVIDRRDDQLLVEVQPQLEVTSIGAGNEAHQDFDQALQLLMRDTGEVLGIRFGDSAPRRLRDAARSIVCGLRFTLPVDAKDAWALDEVDPNGIARLGYRRAAAEEQRTKLERSRLELQVSPELAESGFLPEVAGSGRGTYDASLGWLVAASYEEVTTCVIEAAGMDLQGHAEGQLTLKRTSRVDVTPASERAWSEGWESLTASSDPEAADVEASQRAIYRSRLAGASVGSLSDRMAELLATEPVDYDEFYALRGDLNWLLRLEASALYELEPLVTQAPAELAKALLAAVGAARVEGGEALLARIATSSGGTLELRQASLAAMANLEVAGPQAVGALETLLLEEGDLGAAAMLVGGHLAGRSGAGAAGEYLTAGLLAARPSTNDPHYATWLAGLGNTADPAVVDALGEALQAPDVEARASAARALGNIEGHESNLALNQALLDGAAEVRGQAAIALAGRADSPLDGLRTLLTAERDATVLSSTLQALATRNAEPAVRDLLQELHDGARDPDVRDIAGYALR